MGNQNTILSREHGFQGVGFADDEDLDLESPARRRMRSEGPVLSNYGFTITSRIAMPMDRYISPMIPTACSYARCEDENL